MLAQSGREIRSARRDRGLSMAAVGRASPLSEATVSRLERGLIAHASVRDLARLHAAVGLELSLRSFPGGQPVRDAAQLALLAAFRSRLHRSLAWAVEVPVPIRGDLRASDALVRGPDFRYGVEAETAPRDAQALLRRLNGKARDGAVDGWILVLRQTRQTQAFLAQLTEVLDDAALVPGRRALELLAAGADPRGNAVIVLPRGQRRS